MTAAGRAEEIRRGVARALAAADQAVVAELPLANGRRADLASLDRTGRIAIIEIKSSRPDFQADRKWQTYLDFCDLFYFAVAPEFPQQLLPADEGLIIADSFAAEIVREARLRPLAAARRKAMLVRLAQTAARRLQDLTDPLV